MTFDMTLDSPRACQPYGLPNPLLGPTTPGFLSSIPSFDSATALLHLGSFGTEDMLRLMQQPLSMAHDPQPHNPHFGPQAAPQPFQQQQHPQPTAHPPAFAPGHQPGSDRQPLRTADWTAQVRIVAHALTGPVCSVS